MTQDTGTTRTHIHKPGVVNARGAPLPLDMTAPIELWLGLLETQSHCHNRPSERFEPSHQINAFYEEMRGRKTMLPLMFMHIYQLGKKEKGKKKKKKKQKGQ